MSTTLVLKRYVETESCLQVNNVMMETISIWTSAMPAGLRPSIIVQENLQCVWQPLI